VKINTSREYDGTKTAFQPSARTGCHQYRTGVFARAQRCSTAMLRQYRHGRDVIHKTGMHWSVMAVRLSVCPVFLHIRRVHGSVNPHGEYSQSDAPGGSTRDAASAGFIPSSDGRYTHYIASSFGLTIGLVVYIRAKLEFCSPAVWPHLPA